MVNVEWWFQGSYGFPHWNFVEILIPHPSLSIWGSVHVGALLSKASWVPTLLKGIFFWPLIGDRRPDIADHFSYAGSGCYTSGPSFFRKLVRSTILSPRIWYRFTLSKLSCRLWKSSIFEAKDGHSIGLVVISNRSEQSILKQIDEILLSTIHDTAK